MNNNEKCQYFRIIRLKLKILKRITDCFLSVASFLRTMKSTKWLIITIFDALRLWTTVQAKSSIKFALKILIIDCGAVLVS
jgi:hypothetical protein